MADVHAVVRIPKRGQRAHPENLKLALGGRGRASVAKQDVLDAQEPLGVLFLSGAQDHHSL